MNWIADRIAGEAERDRELDWADIDTDGPSPAEIEGAGGPLPASWTPTTTAHIDYPF